MNTKENNTPQEEEVVKNPEAETSQGTLFAVSRKDIHASK